MEFVYVCICLLIDLEYSDQYWFLPNPVVLLCPSHSLSQTPLTPSNSLKSPFTWLGLHRVSPVPIQPPPRTHIFTLSVSLPFCFNFCSPPLFFFSFFPPHMLYTPLSCIFELSHRANERQQNTEGHGESDMQDVRKRTWTKTLKGAGVGGGLKGSWKENERDGEKKG